MKIAKLPKIRRIRKRVAVVGAARSGKTAFLTSLISHFKDHHPSAFNIDGKGAAKLVFDRVIPPKKGGVEPFPFDQYRHMLSQQGEWPCKTLASSSYAFRFRHSGWRTSVGEMELLDLCGERFADLPMADANYSKWSDRQLGWLRQPGYVQHLGRFWDLVDHAGTCEEKDIIDAYREGLGELNRHFLPHITPSTFAVSPEGVALNGHADSGALNPVGIDFQNEFVPLPMAVRKKQPDLTKLFEQRFSLYKKQIVLPVTQWMKRCDSVVILVDVTKILRTGMPCYNGTRQQIEAVLECLNPGVGLTKVIGGAATHVGSLGWLHWPSIRQVAFVATQCDRVLPQDMAKLGTLLQQMVAPLINSYSVKRRVQVENFVCSSIYSTSAQNGGLQARLQNRPGGKSDDETGLHSYSPSPVPAVWPRYDEDWGDFRYPNVFPRWPELNGSAPDQIGLDKIVGFLLS